MTEESTVLKQPVSHTIQVPRKVLETLINSNPRFCDYTEAREFIKKLMEYQ